MRENQALPRGCSICQQGAKMVLFITGRCLRTCWYCPLSTQRKGRDDIYANEKKVNTPHEALSVARTMDALGSGVTGGEPLLVLERVLSFCRELKGELGEDHHIHLYTGRPRREMSSVHYPASWTRSVCTRRTRNGSRLERVHFSIQ